MERIVNYLLMVSVLLIVVMIFGNNMETMNRLIVERDSIQVDYLKAKNRLNNLQDSLLVDSQKTLKRANDDIIFNKVIQNCIKKEFQEGFTYPKRGYASMTEAIFTIGSGVRKNPGKHQSDKFYPKGKASYIKARVDYKTGTWEIYYQHCFNELLATGKKTPRPSTTAEQAINAIDSYWRTNYPR